MCPRLGLSGVFMNPECISQQMVAMFKAESHGGTLLSFIEAHSETFNTSFTKTGGFGKTKYTPAYTICVTLVDGLCSLHAHHCLTRSTHGCHVGKSDRLRSRAGQGAGCNVPASPPITPVKLPSSPSSPRPLSPDTARTLLLGEPGMPNHSNHCRHCSTSLGDKCISSRWVVSSHLIFRFITPAKWCGRCSRVAY